MTKRKNNPWLVIGGEDDININYDIEKNNGVATYIKGDTTIIKSFKLIRSFKDVKGDALSKKRFKVKRAAYPEAIELADYNKQFDEAYKVKINNITSQLKAHMYGVELFNKIQIALDFFRAFHVADLPMMAGRDIDPVEEYGDNINPLHNTLNKISKIRKI